VTAQSRYLGDFTDLAHRCRVFGGGGLPEFLDADVVKGLAWPDDVVEQWLYDHSGFGRFLMDYGGLDLTAIHWHDELVPAEQFLTMSTGPSEAGLIEEFAQNPDHWSEVRRPQGVPQHWEVHGTWLRRPLLIDRTLLLPPAVGLQVIEGRTRVGVLRGFLERGRSVAAMHSAWVARSQ
jgi:hypothetical protein